MHAGWLLQPQQAATAEQQQQQEDRGNSSSSSSSRKRQAEATADLAASQVTPDRSKPVQRQYCTACLLLLAGQLFVMCC
jgi:hypothetical protein